jgi:hypothetical protein
MICRTSIATILLALPLGMLAQNAAQTVAQNAPQDSAGEPMPPITVQIAPPPVALSSAMLGVSSPLGAQASAGKPVYAQYVTEHHQSFTDGNRISRSSTSTIYRDVKGRIRRESQLSIPGLPAGVSASTTFITIIDQPLGFGFILNPQEMVAHRYDLNAARPSYVAHLKAQGGSLMSLKSSSEQPAAAAPAGQSAESVQAAASASRWRLHAFTHRREAAAAPGASNNQLASTFLPDETGFANAPPMRIDQPFLAAPNPVRTENLGEQMILGFRARGTRVITTLPAGEIGNDRPIDIVSEQWFSPELEMVLRSMHRDPWAGEFSTNITRISQGEQPAALFEVPQGYKVIDAATEEEHHVVQSTAGATAPW